MADLLAQSSAWLEDQRTRFMTRTVTYQRADDTVDVATTIGTTVFEIDVGGGALLRLESRDYLILAADLVLAGNPVLPKRGDRVRETSGAQVFVYEVVGPGGGGDEPCWRWSDPYRRTLRIHTKQVDTEDSP